MLKLTATENIKFGDNLLATQPLLGGPTFKVASAVFVAASDVTCYKNVSYSRIA